MPLGGDSEEKGEYMGRDLPWRGNGESQIGHLSPEVLHRGDKPPWLAGPLGLTGSCGKPGLSS